MIYSFEEVVKWQLKISIMFPAYILNRGKLRYIPKKSRRKHLREYIITIKQTCLSVMVVIRKAYYLQITPILLISVMISFFKVVVKYELSLLRK